MIEFSIVYLVIFLFLKNFWIRPYYKTLIISIIIAILDEIHQYFIQGRVCSIWDVLIDIVGMLIMIRIIRFFYFMKDKKQRGKLC